MKAEQIAHLQERLSMAWSKRVTWSLDDRAAVSALLIAVQEATVQGAELKDKALIVIEHIGLFTGDEEGPMVDVYRLAHAANDRCLNRHEDWKAEVRKLYDELVVSGEHKPVSAEENRQKLQELVEKHRLVMSLPLTARAPSTARVRSAQGKSKKVRE